MAGCRGGGYVRQNVALSSLLEPMAQVDPLPGSPSLLPEKQRGPLVVGRAAPGAAERAGEPEETGPGA